MESSGFPSADTFDWRLIQKGAQKRAMILAQNKLQPQEEIDENGDCDSLPKQDVSILNAPKRMIFQDGATTPKRPRIIPLRRGGASCAAGVIMRGQLSKWKTP
jgi:hypothetical protein